MSTTVKEERKELLIGRQTGKNVLKTPFCMLETRKMAFVGIIVVCTHQMDFVSPGVDLVLLLHWIPPGL